MDLSSLGWDALRAEAFAEHAAAGLVPARVALEHKHAYVLLGEAGELAGEVRGRLLKGGAHAGLPAVGDWLAVETTAAGRARIHAVLPRRTCFSRRAAGDREAEQVVATNVDTVFLMSGLDVDFNPRRIERYLALARASGARPVVVLNKADLCPATEERLAEIRGLAHDAEVRAVSAASGEGVERLAPHLGRGRTVALLGSSGVGKSTLVNHLLGTRRQLVGAVKADDGRGRHTTTRRELIALPGGALLIDTPGMRELQLWGSVREGVEASFPEVVRLAEGCRFRDCRHEGEPGCAVEAAGRSGALAPERHASFLKLRAELEALERGRVEDARRGGPRVTGRRIMRG